ncbi:isopeptide-forming domain-containing fimbrial protein, partial [Bacillus sp. AFS033286]|uniref:isopeptide-forming domain-containing fimbrial protein n=1 Tax=Bacillus sp. AFS033286 TaxID=2033498 RepID=UPI000C037C76
VTDSDETLVEKATLKAQNELFTYDVNYAFGNGTGTWKEARLTDELVSVLEVKGAKLVDSEGKEIKTGKLNIEGNKVEFVFDKKDDSYLYLAGQTYTLKIDAKIKDGVKAEELAPYLEKDGVPNTGELHIGGDKPLVSNEVYVVPPTEKQPEPVKPEEPKQPEPVKPEEPKQPESKPEQKKVEKEKHVMPLTGGKVTYFEALIGAGIMLLAGVLFVVARRQKNKDAK